MNYTPQDVLNSQFSNMDPIPATQPYQLSIKAGMYILLVQ